MAKLAVTVTLIFLFFTVSYAHTPLDLPESDTNPSILLPDEKSQSDPITETKSEITDPNLTESNPIGSSEDLPSAETYIVDVDRITLTRPVNMVSFRPINRHFNVQRQFGLRRCRHHKKAMNLRFHGREVPYGDDMILSGEGRDFDPAFRGGVRQIPATRVSFHHHDRQHHDHDGFPEFPFEHGIHKFGKEKYKRHFEHEQVAEEREEGGGLMKRIRKFLNHF